MLLKIKDNVDLKELEKFGFNNKYNNVSNYEKVIDYGITIWVENNHYIGIENSMSYFYDNDIVKPYIQDLIQAGIVEEVKINEI